MKKILCVLLVLVTMLGLTGCVNDKKYNKLSGDDLTAYNLMLEVCYVANDPAKVKVISGTVTDDKGVFKVSYNNEEIYNVLVYEKNGKYIAEKVYDEAASMYNDLLYNTDSFSAKNVNEALEEKWER